MVDRNEVHDRVECSEGDGVSVATSLSVADSVRVLLVVLLLLLLLALPTVMAVSVAEVSGVDIVVITKEVDPIATVAVAIAGIAGDRGQHEEDGRISQFEASRVASHGHDEGWR